MKTFRSTALAIALTVSLAVVVRWLGIGFETAPPGSIADDDPKAQIRHEKAD